MSRGWIPFAAGAAAGLVGGTLAARYRDEKRRLITLLLAGSRVVATDPGPVEYAVLGDRPAILISPGTGGGYDQGLFLATLFRGSGLAFVCPSRPGYLRTPLSAGRTPEQQADVFAALLDALDIEQVAVLSVSAGGPAALQFALHYPDRCWGLVLASAITQPQRLQPSARLLRSVALQTDFFPWLFERVAERWILAYYGIGPALFARVRRDPETIGVLRGLLKGGVTASLRRAGMRNDAAQMAILPAYDVEHLTVPLLVVHDPDDPVAPFADAERTARAVPGAHLVAARGGGHLCLVTHRQEIVPQVVRFLARYLPRKAALREVSLQE